MPIVTIANYLFDKEDPKPDNKTTNTNKNGNKDTKTNER
ncbi:MAG: hypothetical protein K0Q99_1357 [Clostridia bacterium]|jgi:hypothetical protein|nr:hypothetical protein [Clostridia bacterium]